MEPLTETDIRTALSELAERLSEKRAQGRLYIAGGAAMALLRQRQADLDIDAAITHGHGAVIDSVQQIAHSRGWPRTWLNEQATLYMPKVPDRHGQVVFDHPALKVVSASPEHMPAMEVRAA